MCFNCTYTDCLRFGGSAKRQIRPTQECHCRIKTAQSLMSTEPFHGTLREKKATRVFKKPDPIAAHQFINRQKKTKKNTPSSDSKIERGAPQKGGPLQNKQQTSKCRRTMKRVSLLGFPFGKATEASASYESVCGSRRRRESLAAKPERGWVGGWCSPKWLIT